MMNKIPLPLLSLVLIASTAAAQDKPEAHYNPIKKVEGLEKKHEGWKKKVDLGASISLAQNSNVVGTSDGTTLALGAQVKSEFDWARGNHEWLNAFDLGETFTYASTLDEFIKTTDEIKLKSSYLYHISSLPWLGPFGELKFQTALFQGRDIRGKTVTYRIKRPDGTTYDQVGESLDLSDAFSPLTLKETVGAFARPMQHERLVLEVRLGFSAQQTFADDQKALNDDSDTDEVEIKELQTVYQGGPALGLFLYGELVEKKILWNAQAELMLPAINNKDETDDRNAGELMNVAFGAGLSVKLVSWASLNYTFKAVREPQLVDAWQLQNSLLVTFSYSFLDE